MKPAVVAASASRSPPWRRHARGAWLPSRNRAAAVPLGAERRANSVNYGYRPVRSTVYPRAMRYALAILDLDGTLADSLPWFRGHVNDVADRFGFRRVAEEDIGPLRRAGTREILARLEVPRWKLPMIARYMRRLKAAHLAEIPLFPGAGAMLRALREGGVRLALVSSDLETNARAQLGGANAALISDFACGASLFGKAAKFRRVVRLAGVAPASAIAIGDEVRDIEAARAVGLACGAVAWGYAAPETLRALEPDLLFERMEDIARVLLPQSDGAQ
jgi:phosphoglycolate phosphatase